MTYLKRLALSFTLMTFLALSAFAGETQGPGCPPPVPGQTDTPPCTGAPPAATDGSEAPGETQGPPASTTADVLTVAEAEVLHWALSLI